MWSGRGSRKPSRANAFPLTGVVKWAQRGARKLWAEKSVRKRTGQTMRESRSKTNGHTLSRNTDIQTQAASGVPLDCLNRHVCPHVSLQKTSPWVVLGTQGRRGGSKQDGGGKQGTGLEPRWTQQKIDERGGRGEVSQNLRTLDGLRDIQGNEASLSSHQFS